MTDILTTIGSIFKKSSKDFMDTVTGTTETTLLNTFRSKKIEVQSFVDSIDIKTNNIISTLINQYLKGNQLLAYQLLNSKICKDAAIFLSNNINKQMQNITVKDMKLLFEQKKIACSNNNSCAQVLNNIKFTNKKNKSISKREVCDAIAIFNIRVLNLISTLLLQIDPLNNIAIKRMNTLFNSISEITDERNSEKLSINLCSQQNNHELALLQQYGINELLNLFMYNLLINSDYDSITSETLNKNLVAEYNNIVNILAANLSKSIDKLLVEDIKLMTTEIKSGLREYHSHIMNIPIDNNNNKNNNKQNNITYQTIINEQSNTISMLKDKVNSLERQMTISKENKINTNKSNNKSNNESNNEKIKNIVSTEQINELKEQLALLKTKLDNATKEINILRKEDNNEEAQKREEQQTQNTKELEDLKSEILNLVTKTSLKPIQGGALEATLERFKQFIAKYNVGNTELTERFFKLFNTKFRLDENKVDDICKKVDDNELLILSITSEDTRINKYLNIYNTMSNYYMNEINRMIELLETEILMIKYDDNEYVSDIKIRISNEKELANLETRVRLMISKYINQIHSYYLEGINELNKFLAE